MKCMLSSCLILIAVLLAAAPVSAHGWAFTGPSGGGAQIFAGPQGGGENGFDQVEPTPVQDLGTDPESSPEPESAPDPEGPTGVPRTGAANSGLSSGSRSMPAGRPKQMARPWVDRIHVPWKAVFQPSQGGYDADLAAGLTLSEADGGWARREAPSIVALYNPTSESHRAVMAKLDADPRFVASAHLFNCFRLARTDGKSADVMLMVFDRDGKEVGRITGNRRLHQANRLLRSAYGDELTKALPQVQSVIEGIAYCDHEMEWMEAKVICPDCGHERHDVKETIGQMEIRRSAFEKALDGMR